MLLLLPFLLWVLSACGQQWHRWLRQTVSPSPGAGANPAERLIPAGFCSETSHLCPGRAEQSLQQHSSVCTCSNTVLCMLAMMLSVHARSIAALCVLAVLLLCQCSQYCCSVHACSDAHLKQHCSVHARSDAALCMPAASSEDNSSQSVTWCGAEMLSAWRQKSKETTECSWQGQGAPRSTRGPRGRQWRGPAGSEERHWLGCAERRESSLLGPCL